MPIHEVRAMKATATNVALVLKMGIVSVEMTPQVEGVAKQLVAHGTCMPNPSPGDWPASAWWAVEVLAPTSPEGKLIGRPSSCSEAPTCPIPSSCISRWFESTNTSPALSSLGKSAERFARLLAPQGPARTGSQAVGIRGWNGGRLWVPHEAVLG